MILLLRYRYETGCSQYYLVADLIKMDRPDKYGNWSRDVHGFITVEPLSAAIKKLLGKEELTTAPASPMKVEEIIKRKESRDELGIRSVVKVTDVESDVKGQGKGQVEEKKKGNNNVFRKWALMALNILRLVF